jgi:hypothetical protein
MVNEKILENNTVESKHETQELTSYHPPHLEKLGDLRSLTLGFSGGMAESAPDDPRNEFPI